MSCVDIPTIFTYGVNPYGASHRDTVCSAMNIAARNRSQAIRLILALAIGCLVGLFYAVFGRNIDGYLPDIGWSFNAARDLLAHRDPYRHPVSEILIPYPLTAALLVLPWALLPGNLGVASLFAGATGLLAYGLPRDGQYWRLMVFATPSFFLAIICMQWSPFMMLVLVYPALAPLLLAKPTLAFPVALSIKWTRLRLLGCLILGLVSLCVMPQWPLRWLAQTHNYAGFVPLITWFGPLMLLCFLCWRAPQARFLFLLALTPQHRFFYDQLLVWMIPQSRRQMLVLAYSGWLGYFLVRTQYDTFWPSAPYLMAFIYLPALAIVLWQRGILQSLWQHVAPKNMSP